MSLSVLQLAPKGEHILYDGEKKETLLIGSEDECRNWKHAIEESIQQTANREYMDKLRAERLELLINAGHSQESATDFLKQNMSYLF